MIGKIIDAGIVIGLLFMIAEGSSKHNGTVTASGIMLLVVFIIVLLATKSPRGAKRGAKPEEKDKK